MHTACFFGRLDVCEMLNVRNSRPWAKPTVLATPSRTSAAATWAGRTLQGQCHVYPLLNYSIEFGRLVLFLWNCFTFLSDGPFSPHYTRQQITTLEQAKIIIFEWMNECLLRNQNCSISNFCPLSSWMHPSMVLGVHQVRPLRPDRKRGRFLQSELQRCAAQQGRARECTILYQLSNVKLFLRWADVC